MAAGLQIVDVREPDEFARPARPHRGCAAAAAGRAARSARRELTQERPIVTVCRAGARSAQAAAILRKAGFGNVANLAGGMLRWRAQNLPSQGGQV